MNEHFLTLKKTTLLALSLTLTTNIFSQSLEKDDISTSWEKMHQSKEQALRDFNEAKFGMVMS